ncbi:MAG: hypothetical protein OEW90_04985 [Betaproteobacteria bacterium]|nr:hypothetical protein [Betaproteobacteria bacterium]MDH4323474.1 hypothetical protein [Betaproteobacteria bacterium]
MPSIGRKIKVPALGDIPPDTPKPMRDLLESIIYSLDVREGRVAARTNSRFVTIQDLVDAAVVNDGVIE